MILRRFAHALRRQDWTGVLVELVIVVTGLLIGLQLNDWANTQAEGQRLQDYYRQIIIDLEADIASAGRAIRAADTADADGTILMRMIQDDDTTDLDDGSLVRAVVTAGYAYMPRTSRQTFDELISNGQLRLIKDLALKRALGDYYAKREGGRQWDELIQHEQKAYRTAIRGLLTRDQMRWVRQNVSRVETAPPPFDRKAFLAGVRERADVATALPALAAVQERLRDQGEDMAREARTLIALLQDRIEGD